MFVAFSSLFLRRDEERAAALAQSRKREQEREMDALRQKDRETEAAWLLRHERLMGLTPEAALRVIHSSYSDAACPALTDPQASCPALPPWRLSLQAQSPASDGGIKCGGKSAGEGTDIRRISPRAGGGVVDGVAYASLAGISNVSMEAAGTTPSDGEAHRHRHPLLDAQQTFLSGAPQALTSPTRSISAGDMRRGGEAAEEGGRAAGSTRSSRAASSNGAQDHSAGHRGKSEGPGLAQASERSRRCFQSWRLAYSHLHGGLLETRAVHADLLLLADAISCGPWQSHARAPWAGDRRAAQGPGPSSALPPDLARWLEPIGSSNGEEVAQEPGAGGLSASGEDREPPRESARTGGEQEGALAAAAPFALIRNRNAWSMLGGSGWRRELKVSRIFDRWMLLDGVCASLPRNRYGAGAGARSLSRAWRWCRRVGALEQEPPTCRCSMIPGATARGCTTPSSAACRPASFF